MQNKPFIATRELVVFPGVVTPIFIGSAVKFEKS